MSYEDEFRSVAIHAIAYCARLQHADDVPKDVREEARVIVRKWSQYQARKNMDAQKQPPNCSE